jgi:hypothetical protein
VTEGGAARGGTCARVEQAALDLFTLKGFEQLAGRRTH